MKAVRITPEGYRKEVESLGELAKKKGQPFYILTNPSK